MKEFFCLYLVKGKQQRNKQEEEVGKSRNEEISSLKKGEINKENAHARITSKERLTVLTCDVIDQEGQEGV